MNEDISGGPIRGRGLMGGDVPLDSPQRFQSRVPVVAENVTQGFVAKPALAGQCLRSHAATLEEGANVSHER